MAGEPLALLADAGAIGQDGRLLGQALRVDAVGDELRQARVQTVECFARHGRREPLHLRQLRTQAGGAPGQLGRQLGPLPVAHDLQGGCGGLEGRAQRAEHRLLVDPVLGAAEQVGNGQHMRQLERRPASCLALHPVGQQMQQGQPPLQALLVDTGRAGRQIPEELRGAGDPAARHALPEQVADFELVGRQGVRQLERHVEEAVVDGAQFDRDGHAADRPLPRAETCHAAHARSPSRL